jgi:hypothetical protein
MGAALQRSGEGKGGGGGEVGRKEVGWHLCWATAYWAAVACARPVAWFRASQERHRRSMPLHVTAVRMMILVGLRSSRLVKAAFAHSAHRCICDCVTASPHCTHSHVPRCQKCSGGVLHVLLRQWTGQHEVPAFFLFRLPDRQHEGGRGRIVSALELFLFSPCDC